MITVSIPLYNTSKWISRAIMSVFNQTFTDYELLLIDDCGDDNSVEIAEKLIQNHRLGYKARIIHHPYNMSLGTVRNTAIDEAQGDYIMFLDGDDALLPNCLEILMSSVTSYPYDFVAGSAECRSNDGILDENATSFNRYRLTDIELYDHNQIIQETLIKCNIYIPIWNKLYKLSFLRDNGIRAIDNIYNEDEFFSFQVYLCATSCKLVSSITANHYVYKKQRKYGYSSNNHIQERKIRDYMEITRREREYIKSFKEQTYYWDIVWRIFLLHNGEFCNRVKKHKELPCDFRKEAIEYLSCMPVSFRDILADFPHSFKFIYRYLLYHLTPNHYRIIIPRLS